MFKILSASAVLFAAPAMAQSIKPANALMGIVRMEAAKQFCGLQIDQQTLMELVDIVTPHVKKTPQEFVEAVRRTAEDLGANHVNNGTIGVFCAEIGRIYGRHGK